MKKLLLCIVCILFLSGCVTTSDNSTPKRKKPTYECDQGVNHKGQVTTNCGWKVNF